ncbi:hypothetical protein T484DRAFT_1642407, partial [Baffinella frigidus]
TLYTIHYTPYTINPTPYNLSPTPYTLHPKPYTLNQVRRRPRSQLLGAPHLPLFSQRPVPPHVVTRRSRGSCAPINRRIASRCGHEVVTR